MMITRLRDSRWCGINEKIAKFWSVVDGSVGVKCGLCPHRCVIGKGGSGLCGVRVNTGAALVSECYGTVSALALDPIEKKPLHRFYPGSHILSVGSYGCNMRCPFCQNHGISTVKPDSTKFISPSELAQKSLELKSIGNIGVAYTYNEPSVGIEYVLECGELVRAEGQKNVLVTNGLINEEPLRTLLEFTDALNIDLKCFTESGYKKLGGDLLTVKNTIALSAEKCHVEITSLIVPGLNDNEGEMEEQAEWLASISTGIPLHITRYFPRYKSDEPPTAVSVLRRLMAVAEKHLKYVYIGNI